MLLVHQVTLETLDQLDCKVYQAVRVPQERLDILGHPEHQATKVPLEFRVQLVQLDLLDQLEAWASLDQKVLLVTLEILEQLEQLDL